MSHKFRLVAWDPFKIRYDLAVVGAAGLFVVSYVATGAVVGGGSSLPGAEVLVLRASGALAMVLLHVILMIGPAARLWPRLLPLLYNRRHLGVMTFFVALIHGTAATIYYHGFGTEFPLLSLANGAEQTVSLGTVPFQILGAGGLVIMSLLALTSHDFWLKVMTPMWWKRLHVCVYLAYALLVAHVLLGAIQQEKSPLLGAILGVGCAMVVGLQIASRFTRRNTPQRLAVDQDQWVQVASAEDIEPGRAKVIETPSGERIAIFNHEDRLLAVSNRCAHQGGPLGEGAIVNGCVTCPWHGHQFDPATGCAPAPYSDRIPTHALRIERGRVEVRISASPLGETQTGVSLKQLAHTAGGEVAPEKAGRHRTLSGQFFVGYLPMSPGVRRSLMMGLVGIATAMGFAGGIIAAHRKPAGPAVWETEAVQVIEGRIIAKPYPHVLLEKPGLGIDAGRAVLLAEEGKHGAARVIELDGSRVRLKGLALRRGSWRMLELVAGADAIEILNEREPVTALADATDEGPGFFEGEIVDSKCFLGAMRPGDGIVHRACAILCIKGGIPPVLVVRGQRLGAAPADDPVEGLIVTERDGSGLSDRHRNLIGLAVEVRGKITERYGMRVLAVESIQPMRFGMQDRSKGASGGLSVLAAGLWPEVCGGR